MKIWTIARATLGTFLRNRLFIVFGVLFLCAVLFMLTPLLMARAMAKMGNVEQAQNMVLDVVSFIMFFVSGVGSLLAAWCAADSVASEMKSGTILAVMARPVKRWEFLLGKFVGVMLLMSAYVVMMYGLSWLLAWIGGQRIQSTPWVLFAYPLVRYAVYAAIAMEIVTLLHPVVTIGITFFIAVLAMIVRPPGNDFFRAWKYFRVPLWIVLPSTSLLSEDRFLVITRATLKPTDWIAHLTALSYGLDYALVFLLLAMWSFHYKSLTRD